VVSFARLHGVSLQFLNCPQTKSFRSSENPQLLPEMGTVDRNRSNRQEEMAAVKSKIFIVVGAFLLLWFARFVWDYFDPTSDANQSMQIQLKVFGSAMYEYHAATK